MRGTCDGEPRPVPVADGCSWKIGALARALISCSPSCQCMDSADRQGMPISVATFCHIWSLNLFLKVSLDMENRAQNRRLMQAPYEMFDMGVVRPNMEEASGEEASDQISGNFIHMRKCGLMVQGSRVVHTERRVLPACSSSPRPRWPAFRGSSDSAGGKRWSSFQEGVWQYRPTSYLDRVVRW